MAGRGCSNVSTEISVVAREMVDALILGLPMYIFVVLEKRFKPHFKLYSTIIFPVVTNLKKGFANKKNK